MNELTSRVHDELTFSDPMQRKNPYSTKNGGPKRGQFAEWFIIEQARELERRATLTPEQLQTEDESRRLLQQRMQSESEFVSFTD